MSKYGRDFRSLCAVLVVLLAGAAGRGEEQPLPQDSVETPEERILTRDVRGRVVDAESGNPVAGASVSLLYEATLSDGEGYFLFESVPLIHFSEISVRVKNDSGYIIACMIVDVSSRFYPIAAEYQSKMSVAIVDPALDDVVELRLKDVSPADVNGYCDDCHLENPCLEVSTFEEVLQEGRNLRGIIVMEDQIDSFREAMLTQGVRKDSYKKIRYQDTHKTMMDMELVAESELYEYKGLYRIPELLNLWDSRLVTCDTCHTRHIPTNQKQYVVMPFEENSSLCIQCHL